MRKNSKILTLAVAAAVMMAVTACGSKDKAETTAAETVTETEATTEAAGTTEEESASTGVETGTEELAAAADADSGTDAEDADAEDEAGEAEETAASEAGEIGSNGIFKAASGRFEIKVPQGWSIDENSDHEYVTFFSANGEDMLEIINVSGDTADGIREIYPDTAEEYQRMVSRGDGMEILSYNVETGEDGSQTFQYSVKYADPGDGIHFLAESGKYDASEKTYLCVTGTVVSSDDAVIKQVEEAVKSFEIH